MKKVLITGASAGIGAEIARVLYLQGYKTFITGRNEIALKNTPHTAHLAGDLLDDKFCTLLIEKAIKELNGIDILINNAGIYFWGALEKAPLETVENTFKLNLQIPYYLSQLIIPSFKAQGSGCIINIGSISGIVGEANASLYSASKAGLLGLTKALALELAEYNININLISPGWVKTDLTDKAFEFENNFTEKEQLEIIPQKRWIEPKEIADLIIYLISDSAKGITGQNINLCAGLSLG